MFFSIISLSRSLLPHCQTKPKPIDRSLEWGDWVGLATPPETGLPADESWTKASANPSKPYPCEPTKRLILGAMFRKSSFVSIEILGNLEAIHTKCKQSYITGFFWAVDGIVPREKKRSLCLLFSPEEFFS